MDYPGRQDAVTGGNRGKYDSGDGTSEQLPWNQHWRDSDDNVHDSSGRLLHYRNHPCSDHSGSCRSDTVHQCKTPAAAGNRSGKSDGKFHEDDDIYNAVVLCIPRIYTSGRSWSLLGGQRDRQMCSAACDQQVSEQEVHGRIDR